MNDEIFNGVSLLTLKNLKESLFMKESYQNNCKALFMSGSFQKDEIVPLFSLWWGTRDRERENKKQISV